MEWYDWISLVLTVAVPLLWGRRRRMWPVLVDPNRGYEVFCRDFDVEVEAEELDSTLGLNRTLESKERLAEIEEGLAAGRARHDVAVREAAARIRSATSRDVLEDAVVSLLVDHSGSMRGEPIRLAAGALMTASELLHGLGAKQEVLGFTTVRWKGGRSREKWLRFGRPRYPGRLNDILHIIYCSAGEKLNARHYAMMLREGLLKENLDGEAIEWAASRLRKRGERHKYLIVVSDGAPVDDSTLSENSGAYLENHLRGVIRHVTQAGDIELAAVGINHPVDRYYERSVTVNTPDDLGKAVLELIEQLLCAPRTDGPSLGRAPFDQHAQRPM